MKRVYINSSNYLIIADNTDVTIDTRNIASNVYAEINGSIYAFYKKSTDELIESIDFSDILDADGVAYLSQTVFTDLIESSGKIKSTDYLEVSKENVQGESIINKFGRNGNVGTSLVPVSIGGNYRTPTTATSVEVVSTDVNDTYLGTGARTIRITGLDANYDVQQEDIQMNGITAVVSANTWTRIFRYSVLTSGTYASQTSGSHFGDLIIQEVGAGAEWVRISVEGSFGIGQSQIGSYTIPRGYTGYLLSKHISVESTKPASLYFFKRENINDVTAPFTGTMRLFEENDGIEVPFQVNPKAPLAVFPEMTDIGFLAKVGTGTASISVDFQIHLIKN